MCAIRANERASDGYHTFSHIAPGIYKNNIPYKSEQHYQKPSHTPKWYEQEEVVSSFLSIYPESIASISFAPVFFFLISKIHIHDTNCSVHSRVPRLSPLIGRFYFRFRLFFVCAYPVEFELYWCCFGYYFFGRLFESHLYSVGSNVFFVSVFPPLLNRVTISILASLNKRNFEYTRRYTFQEHTTENIQLYSDLLSFCPVATYRIGSRSSLLVRAFLWLLLLAK